MQNPEFSTCGFLRKIRQVNSWHESAPESFLPVDFWYCWVSAQINFAVEKDPRRTTNDVTNTIAKYLQKYLPVEGGGSVEVSGILRKSAPWKHRPREGGVSRSMSKIWEKIKNLKIFGGALGSKILKKSKKNISNFDLRTKIQPKTSARWPTHNKKI